MSSSAVCDRDVRRVASRSPYAHVAIEARSGPHVTPVLYALVGDRLWLVVERATLKARVLAQRPRVGVLLDAGDECVVIRGEATVLNPWQPIALARRLDEMARAPLAGPAFVARNALELLAFPRDLGLRPPDVVAIGIRAHSAEVVRRPGVSGGPAPLDADVPGDLAKLAEAPGPAALGWQTADGPLALPAAWDPAAGTADIPAVLPAGVQAPACVTFDVTRRRGPLGKAGLMLRGNGRTTGEGTVAVEVARATWFEGFASGTVPARVGAPRTTRARRITSVGVR